MKRTICFYAIGGGLLAALAGCNDGAVSVLPGALKAAPNTATFDPAKVNGYREQFPFENPKQVIELFGQDIRTVTLEKLSAAIRQAGGKPGKSNATYASFSAANLLPGASTLEVYALPDGQVTEATYTLPSFMDVGQVKRMADLVGAKYGEMTGMDGEWAVGGLSAEWHRGDNSYVSVSRSWPSTTTQVSYINLSAKNYRETLVKEMQEQKQQNRAKALGGSL